MAILRIGNELMTHIIKALLRIVLVILLSNLIDLRLTDGRDDEISHIKAYIAIDQILVVESLLIIRDRSLFVEKVIEKLVIARAIEVVEIKKDRQRNRKDPKDHLPTNILHFTLLLNDLS